MADDESSTTSEESVDVKSDKFDPMKALYSSKTQLSLKTPVYDNVSKFEAVMSGLSDQMKTKNKLTNVKQGESSKQRSLPGQEPVSGTRIGGRTRNSWKNVLSKMQRTLGPLGVLHEYMESRTRVKVYTRNACGIRGHVEAYVAAFDKHWNLALEDCFEVWTRSVKRKAPALGSKRMHNCAALWSYLWMIRPALGNFLESIYILKITLTYNFEREGRSRAQSTQGIPLKHISRLLLMIQQKCI
ncbi:U7 snRNA-associated Sm-like protein LSm11 isoform X1 [Hylaeus anthracinus]|uniref:U7 snRNA-associated Sm-like protein LSm11 isoform X1 n=1 Tax=Hylaeus anthracinus TaxID=313031 RepID=UPI0023BA2321|nr:U7 snRNA-associated Sm-like protein LSm11 isoform X1 [Hylaeus anthracinus]XP_054008675.1 U7 snRNA-associated Sm-like protein LSm11 isoform X1 [Hylaeus anthracinus]